MNDEAGNILIYGYGNPGRQDDALGIMLAGEIESWKNERGISSVEIDMNYSLISKTLKKFLTIRR